MFVGGMDDSRVAGVLKAVGLARVDHPIDLALFPHEPVDVAVVDPAAFGLDGVGGLRAAAERLGDTPFVILSGPCDRDTLVGYLRCPNTHAIVARDRATADAALAVAVRSVVRGPRFGLTAGDGAPRFETRLSASRDRERVLSQLAEFASLQGVRRRRADVAIDATEELITNALYDAPTDAQGRRIYAEIDRRHAVFLAEGARPWVRAAVADGQLHVSVEDSFGSLTLATVKRYLAQGIGRGPCQVDGKRGGAGLGFARIFAQVDRMAVHRVPGARTEVLVTIGLSGRGRNMASRPTGLLLAEAKG